MSHNLESAERAEGVCVCVGGGGLPKVQMKDRGVAEIWLRW